MDLLAFPLVNYENILFDVGRTRKRVSYGNVKDFSPILEKLIQVGIKQCK